MGTGKGGKGQGGKGEDMGKDMCDKGEDVEAAWERATRLGDVNWDNWFELYLQLRGDARDDGSGAVVEEEAWDNGSGDAKEKA